MFQVGNKVKVIDNYGHWIVMGSTAAVRGILSNGRIIIEGTSATHGGQITQLVSPGQLKKVASQGLERKKQMRQVYAIGDRVAYYVRSVKSDLSRLLLGKHGTILDWNGRRYLVEFDQDISDVGGHSGDGEGREGHCLWIREEFISPVSVESKKKEGVKSMVNKLNVIAQKILDSDLRTLVKAGVLNSDLTIRDADAVLSLVVISNKKELAALAKARMKDAKSDEDEE